MIAINSIQKKYCRSIIDILKKTRTDPVPIIWEGDTFQHGRPIIENFYLKSVVVMAPHLNYPGIIPKCQVCTKELTPKGWSDEIIGMASIAT